MKGFGAPERLGLSLSPHLQLGGCEGRDVLKMKACDPFGGFWMARTPEEVYVSNMFPNTL